ncbi:MAG: hypothetical protein O3A47_03030, partial [Chloroflexi bacterium]|nr:hypothetical protein [Chloroflexota bacterium]
DNVLCYSYGVPANRESARSEQVAEVLGYPWVQTPYSPDVWRNAFGSAEMREYRSFAANGVSFPHHDDWPAVRALREKGAVSADAVFAPGHAADFIAGDHLKYLFDPLLWEGDPHDIEGALVKKHYSLWHDFVGNRQVRDAIGRRIEESVGMFPRDTDEDVARMFEYWEWQERQSKFIINAVRVYEFFGFSWRIPFWDRALMDFWRPITIALKMREQLYRRYVQSHDHMDLFQEDGPLSTWSRDLVAQRRPKRLRRRAYDAASRLPGVARLNDRYRMYRRHLREWNRDPREEAHAYGKLRYLLLDPGKRHVQSLALRDFLRDEYGLEMSSLGRGQETGNSARPTQAVCGPGAAGRSHWP